MEIFKNIITKTTYQRIVKENAQVLAPSVLITTDALMKMRAMVDSCDKEIAWLCVVDLREDGAYVIEDTILFKQDVSASTADICEVALNEFASELALSGRMDLFNKIRGWGHSHVNMGVFASGTDETTFKSFYSTCDYFIRLICNKSGDLKLDLVDCTGEIRFDNIVWKELMSEEQATLNALIEQFNEKFVIEKARVIAEIKTEMAEKVITTHATTGIVKSQWMINEEYRQEEARKKKEAEEEQKGSLTLNGISMADLYFDELEIITLAKECPTTHSLRVRCEKDISFLDFTTIDWADLFDSVQDVAIYLNKCR